MLKEIYSHKTVRSAAKSAAGNWQEWREFAWFGADEVPHSNQVMLGYTLNHEPTVVDLACHNRVGEALKPYLGDIRKDATAEDYRATAHGDIKLRGFMVRVYEPSTKTITAAFKALYDVAKKTKGGTITSDQEYAAASRNGLLEWAARNVGYYAEKFHVRASTCETLVDALIDDGTTYDNLDELSDEAIGKVLKELS